jgi:hypothetical protein
VTIHSRLARACVRRALAFLALSPLSALALTEFQKITPSDPALNDNFGYSVGISGNTAILGSWKDDISRPGDDSGSAYIFRDNGTGTWTQLDKLIASDAGNGHNFGASVAIDGNTAAIGALLKGNTGGAYVFRDNGAGDWMQVDTLAPTDAMNGDEFGYSIAISGNTAVVGAWKKDASRGAAYVFRDNGTGDWMQVGKLTANDAMPSDQFGVAVAISGTTALVGSHFNNMAAPLGGAVYVFEESGGSWSQVDKLTASDASLNDRFGSSIALDDGTAIIGAPNDADGGVDAGAAYIFRRNASMEFQEVTKLVADDAEPSNRFGHSVGLSDGAAIVGSFQDNDGGLASGSAYFFQESGPGEWFQAEKLLASDAAPNNAFGYSVGISEGIGLVGAPLSNEGGTDAGIAYLFNVPGNVPGDYNQNGVVDAADYALWRDMLGQMGPGLPADGNGDGTVNDADYDLWRANFGLGSPGEAAAALQSAAVPEPGTAALLICAASYLTLSTLRRYPRSETAASYCAV